MSFKVWLYNKKITNCFDFLSAENKKKSENSKA